MKQPAGTLPKRFRPKFWTDADNRCALVRQIKKRVEQLQEDTGADSYQKEILCERAAFMALQLETIERNATESGTFDPGPYVQAVNCLIGLLRSLGLDKKVKAVGLRAYMEQNSA
jgi:hypothetical protein